MEKHQIVLSLTVEAADQLFKALNTAMLTKGYEHGIIAVPVMNSINQQYAEIQKKQSEDAAKPAPVTGQTAE